jgi:hypothetical protein
MKCSNCEGPIDTTTAIIVSRGHYKEVAAVICGTCLKDVLTLKIVLARTSVRDELKFDGYLPVASAK